MDTHDALVDHLITATKLKTPHIIDAFRHVDRRNFVPEEALYGNEDIYADRALPIGHDQTISQPSTVAFMLELLQPHSDDKIMDVGAGSGWTTALLGHIVGNNGAVYGVEIIPDLVEFGKKNLAKYQYAHATIEQAGQLYGLPKNAPYTKILVSAAGSDIPKEFIDQLSQDHGVLVMPIYNDIVRYIKSPHAQDVIERYEGFVFVPLIRPDDTVYSEGLY